MKYFLSLILAALLITGCMENENQPVKKNKNELPALFENYYNERMKLFPLESTANGDTLYNDQLPIEFTDEYVSLLKDFYSKYVTALQAYCRSCGI
jgi:hypothetical protein